MKLCLADAQNMNWEVVQPLEGRSMYREFLERHGEGIQHIGVDCDGVPYATKLTLFRERGWEAIQSGVYGGGARFHYFTKDDDLRAVVEVYDVPSGFAFPPVEEWFPGPLPA
jgi:glyoxalase/bleomycin resistance protein/dioxygenase superfamily protein